MQEIIKIIWNNKPDLNLFKIYKNKIELILKNIQITFEFNKKINKNININSKNNYACNKIKKM